MAPTNATLLEALDLVTFGTKPHLEALGNVLGSHFRRLRSVATRGNVVGVGISEKAVAGKTTDEASICFYVKRKRALGGLRGEDVVPSVIRLPGERAVFTDVKELGELHPQAFKKSTPLQSGFSVGHARVRGGTLGAIVRRDGKLHVLSNSHVLARSGKAKIGDPIVYPGTADGGKVPGNLAAKLSDFTRFDKSGALTNVADAAIAEITSTHLGALDTSIYKAAVPLATTTAKRGMKVAKFGRTTGKTTGRVIDVNFRFTLEYPRIGNVGYIDQVLCTRYTEPGDSGALVVDVKNGKIVGLHFAGADGGSVFNPISLVMKALRFRFVSL